MRPSPLKSPLALIAVSLLLSGCAVGPDYEKPATTLPQQWTAGQNQASSAEIQQDWWKNFHDPVLTQLITQASANNLDLKIAAARIAEARAARAGAFAGLLPTGDFKTSATREANQLAVPGNFPGINRPFNIFQTGFDASWELDLFGGHRRELESANAAMEASEASRDDAMVSLLAEVARTYIDIRKYQAEIEIAEKTIGSDKDTLEIAQQRFKAGAAAGLDVTQAKAQEEQAEARLTNVRNQLAQAEYSMDVLLGEQPGAAHALVEKPAPIPSSSEKLILAAPASVIANRPDIRTAERKLASATAQQGVAVAQFFPDISLAGFVGFLSTNSSKLLTAGNKSWMGGANMVWPILSYGNLSANLDAANAQQQEAMAAYQKAIISALSDVERSVTAYTEQENDRKAQEKSTGDTGHAADIARQLYKNGSTPFLDVLDAERTLYASQNQLIEADAQSSQDLIAVYKSLGGGWKQAQKTGAL